MADQVACAFFLQPSETIAVQDCDEKKESENKCDKKEVKDFVSHALAFSINLQSGAKRVSRRSATLSSPVMDYLTPPPDDAARC